MNQRIIYPNDDGGVAIFVPASTGLSIADVAKVVVPTGKPFKIVDVSDIPTDRSQRDAWTVDESELTDGVGADYGAGSDWAVVDWDDDGHPDVLVNQRTGEVKKVSEQ